MQTVDCFFVGINTISIAKQRHMARLVHGKNSHDYRDDTYYRFVKYNGKMYSQAQIFELFHNDDKDIASSYEFPVFEDTFNSTIGYLGSYLSRKGFTIDYINSFNSMKDRLAEKLDKKVIRTIAIPTTHYATSYPIAEIVSFVRKHDASVKVIVGGPYIANQVRALESDALDRLFNSIGADIYVYNDEGENALSEVLKAIKNNLPLDSISNIYIKKDKKFVIKEYYPENNDLDKNDIDWSLFSNNMEKYASVRTSVSCPFSCGFCAYGGRAANQKHRYSSLETIEKELDSLYSTGKVQGIFFSDNTLNVPIPRFKEFLRLLIRKKYGFKWQTHMRCQFIDKETAELLEESGCIQAFCGLESGSQKILDNINKNATVEKCKEGLTLLQEHNIMTVASFFIGYPGETYETAMETYRFIEEAAPTFYQMRLWWYSHSAPIYEQREKYKLEGRGFDWCHETMNSDYAHELVDQFHLNIKNSVHIGDTQNIFDMASSGISVNKVRNFVSAFNDCVKERIRNRDLEDRDSSEELIEKLKIAAKC